MEYAQTEAFDPMTQVPKTDEQAVTALRYGRSPLTGSCLVGLFQVYRAQGKPLLDAYEKALLDHVAAFQGAEETPCPIPSAS